MIVKVKPSILIRGKVCLPASKSYSIRAFIIACCGGKSLIADPSDCEDAQVAMKTAKALGSKVKRIGKNSWKISVDKFGVKQKNINVNESGTVLRFLLPLAAISGKEVVVDGKGTLRGRPNAFLTETLRGMGSKVKGSGKNEGIPVKFSGGELSGGKIAIDGSLSSQFISALLISCPQLEKDSTIVLKGKNIVSSDYITMTLQVLKKAGIKVSKKSSREFAIKGRQKFKGLKNFAVPSDHGLAAFLIAAGVISKSNLVLTGNLKDDLIQADGKIFDVLKKMGVKFKKTSRSITIKGPQKLKGCDISLKDAPDLVPIVSILALFAEGKTRLYDIKHARVKESDRISDLRKELLKIGAKVSEKKNELVIYPQKTYKSNVLLDPHKDHRLAMAFCVLGSKLGVSVKDMECARKSYPGFIKDFKSIGANITKI